MACRTIAVRALCGKRAIANLGGREGTWGDARSTSLAFSSRGWGNCGVAVPGSVRSGSEALSVAGGAAECRVCRDRVVCVYEPTMFCELYDEQRFALHFGPAPTGDEFTGKVFFACW